MIGIAIKHTPVGELGIVILRCVRHVVSISSGGPTHIFLLLVNVTNLKPDVLLCQWRRRIRDNVFEALRAVSSVTSEGSRVAREVE